jgi:hypothetical protein
VDAALSEAVGPVLRDLERSGLPRPGVWDEDWGNDPGMVTAMLGRAGAAQGIWVQAGEPLAERIATVADQVQDWAVEELCSRGLPTNWPWCPDHPLTHPLAPVERDGRAVWTCPKTGRVVCEIGQL